MTRGSCVHGIPFRVCVCVQKRSERVSCFGFVHVCASIAVERYDTAA